MLKGQKQQIVDDIKHLKKSNKIKENELNQYTMAREVIQVVGEMTTKQIEYHINDITSLAMEAVFPNSYFIQLEFLQRRNKTECDIYFTRNGVKFDPLTASGGGAVDIASFALRIASWSLNTPHSRNTIILDEPLRFLSKEYREKASYMIKEISKKLKIQFIIVTHDPVLTAYADKIFEVNINKGISSINTSKQ
jgi:DNA repair exonuclease SbcCD ATPase subunit